MRASDLQDADILTATEVKQAPRDGYQVLSVKFSGKEYQHEYPEGNPPTGGELVQFCESVRTWAKQVEAGLVAQKKAENAPVKAMKSPGVIPKVEESPIDPVDYVKSVLTEEETKLEESKKEYKKLRSKLSKLRKSVKKWSEIYNGLIDTNTEKVESGDVDDGSQTNEDDEEST